MKRPDEGKLSREEGEALIERLNGDALTADDQRILVKLVTFYLFLAAVCLAGGQIQPQAASGHAVWRKVEDAKAA